MKNKRNNKKTSKVIFLDIDGVLVNRESLRNRSGKQAIAHSDCVSALNQITDQTGASIVVSSTWRFMGKKKIIKTLKEWGVKGKILGITPYLPGWENSTYKNNSRGDEIQSWIDNNRPESFIILDDDTDMGHLINRLIKTDSKKGLTKEDAEKAILLFNCSGKTF